MSKKHKMEKNEGASKCVFCNTNTIDDLDLGKMESTRDIQAHYYCVLLSTSISQTGTDTQGIWGFTHSDIMKEVTRSQTRQCFYCKLYGASMLCARAGCGKYFHLTCGRKMECLQNFETYECFCPNHRLLNNLPKNMSDNVTNFTCIGCMEQFQSTDKKSEIIWADCCKAGILLHLNCARQVALNAGYYTKCPGCNNGPIFGSSIKAFGVFIPHRDASWEGNGNEYEDLYSSHARCDIPICLCPNGRTSRANGWRIILCRCCGSFGAHTKCDATVSQQYTCQTCQEVLNKPKTVDETNHPTTVEGNSTSIDSAPPTNVLITHETDEDVKDSDAPAPIVIETYSDSCASDIDDSDLDSLLDPIINPALNDRKSLEERTRENFDALIKILRENLDNAQRQAYQFSTHLSSGLPMSDEVRARNEKRRENLETIIKGLYQNIQNVQMQAIEYTKRNSILNPSSEENIFNRIVASFQDNNVSNEEAEMSNCSSIPDGESTENVEDHSSDSEEEDIHLASNDMKECITEPPVKKQKTNKKDIDCTNESITVASDDSVKLDDVIMLSSGGVSQVDETFLDENACDALFEDPHNVMLNVERVPSSFKSEAARISVMNADNKEIEFSGTQQEQASGSSKPNVIVHNRGSMSLGSTRKMAIRIDSGTNKDEVYFINPESLQCDNRHKTRSSSKKRPRTIHVELYFKFSDDSESESTDSP